MESFGAVLREPRLTVGWTQERLARASGVSAHTIITLETGKRRPRLSTVAALADSLKLGRPQHDQLIAAARATAGDAGGAEMDEQDASMPDPSRAQDLADFVGIGDPVGVFGQLPADLATFTGRREELARFIEAATQDPGGGAAKAVVICTVEGMAGVEKTQLAIHAAHELVRAGHFH